MSAKAPASIRETFELIRDFDGNCGIRQFLSKLDWDGVSVHQVYAAFLDRLPESIDAVRNHLSSEPLALAVNTLGGLEFQKRAIELSLCAFPEKRRLFHIHIPKSAGVDLRNSLVSRYPYLHYNHTQRGSTSPLELFTHLAELSRRAQVSTDILTTGHIPLAWYLQRGLCRFGDRIFSVIRHPVVSLLSLVNYYVRRIRENPACDRPDTRSYARYLKVERFPDGLAIDEQRSLALKMLLNKDMMERTLLTYMLGNKTADSAIDLIIRSNIELVPIESYKTWLREHWHIQSDTWTNKTLAVLKLSDLDEEHLKTINEFCKEDIALYDQILAAHKKRGGTRLFGTDLIKMREFKMNA